MKGYKAFNPGLICKGKQYAENTVFEEDKAVVCNSGMHFCENPFDVLDHYPLINKDGTFSDFAEVEALAEAKTDDHKKYCTTKLKVGAKLSFPGFIKACVDFVIEKTTVDIDGLCVECSSGDAAKIGSSGDAAQINSTGEDSVICCAGHDSSVKAKVGSWITLSEWKYSDEKKHRVPVCVKTEYVDGERIKADTFYKLEGGEFVECQ